MSETVEQVDLAGLLAEAHRIQHELRALDLESVRDVEVVAAVRANERLRRAQEPLDHALLVEVEQRGIAVQAGMRTTALWLRQTVRVDIHEANARVQAARAAGPRRSLLGEALPATFPLVAAAQAAGELGAKQARVITHTLERLSASVGEQVPDAEAELVELSSQFDAAALQKCADRVREWLDPDNGYREVERRRRERDLRFTQRPDGSCVGSFQGTAELAEFLQVTFDSLGAPQPESNGIKDPRTAGQRRHDALLDALKAAVSAGSMPTAGGMLATVVLTMTEHAYRTGEGFATTGHGAQVPVREAMSWAGGDYRLLLTVLNSVKAVVAYSTCHRFFTEGQRLALIARDRGCSFPGCTAPPGWTQAHHTKEWQDTHRTSLDNGCLLCGWHHREFERLGWTVRITDGRPEWTPPRTIDPDRTPIRV